MPETQIEKFIETARELGCDESEERFNENLKRIAKAKPKDGEKADKPTVTRGG